MRVLVLGVTGMLGHTSFQIIGQSPQHEVWGTMRGDGARQYFTDADQPRLVSGVDVLEQGLLEATLDRVAPDVVINCVGLIKQLPEANDPLVALPSCPAA